MLKSLFSPGKISSGYIGMPLVFRVFLLAGFTIIALVFIYYTQHVVGGLKDNSLRMVKLSIRLLQMELSDENSDASTGLIFDEIIAPTDIPIIITDQNDEPLFFRNISGLKAQSVTPQNRARLGEIIAEMNRQHGRFPIKHVDSESGVETIINYFYYGDPKLIRQLQAMPLIEIGLVAAFLMVGYLGYRNIKRSEQHFIWVGMAKETAHQLGTPISSLLGWLEIFKSKCPATQMQSGQIQMDQSVADIPVQMASDIERLQKIANRFSQIGSRPALAKADLNQVLADAAEYFRRRLPYQGTGIRIDFAPGTITKVMLNPELISWVIENLIKNSLEACDPRLGRIRIVTFMSADGKEVITEVSDNGRGIPAGHHKKIFQPGFTSKKLGWGLGLTLARRIIEEYHKGRIVLKSSIPNRETVMQFTLPAEQET